MDTTDFRDTQDAATRKTGRPPIGPRTTIRLTQADYTALDDRADALGVDRSELIRRYVSAGLARPVYTVQIEAGNHDGAVWQPAAPPETVEAAVGETATDIAEWTAANQNVADGIWRVVVWEGADTCAHPVCVLDGLV